MFLLVALLVGVVTVPLTRGRLGYLAQASLRLPLSPLLAVLLQVLIATSGSAPSAVLAVAHVCSYLVAGAFVVCNRHLVGILLLGLGGALNGVVIIANGGVMPASRAAVAQAGLVHEVGRFHNSAILDSPRLAALGDVFALPAAWAGSNVFSAGDVVLFAAGILIVHELAGSPWTRRRGCTPVSDPHVSDRSGDGDHDPSGNPGTANSGR